MAYSMEMGNGSSLMGKSTKKDGSKKASGMAHTKRLGKMFMELLILLHISTINEDIPNIFI